VREGDALLGTDGRRRGRSARKGRRRGRSARGGRRRARSARGSTAAGLLGERRTAAGSPGEGRTAAGLLLEGPTDDRRCCCLPRSTWKKYCLVRLSRWMVFGRLKTLECISCSSNNNCTGSQSFRSDWGAVRNILQELKI
jgi:hypothetical protein